MRDTLYNKTLTRVALPAATRTANAAVNGTSVDLGVFGNDFRTVMFVVQTGTVTDGSWVFTLQESYDNSAWTAVPATRVQGSLPTVVAANDDTVLEFGYVPSDRQYVRVVVTSTGSTTGAAIGAVALCSEASSVPVARA